MAKPTNPAKRKPPTPAEQARIAEIFARFEALESDPRTELDYESPFTLLVAVALSAQ
ncbi:MAG: nth, partial [Phenylobacterium sp.]|nr:nth [Phenylobacterium sp.]